jgi:ATP synthase protein I
MDEFSSLLKTSLRIWLLFLSAFFFAWAVLPAYRHEVTGLILGTIVSFISSRHLAWRVQKLTKAVAEKTKASKGLGFGTRAALAALVTFFCLKMGYSVVAFIIGLFFVQMATLLLGIISNRKKEQ